MATKYHVEISSVREVSLLGTADLAFWTERLSPLSLHPAVEQGRAAILIVAAGARFMGVSFREVSVSVFVTRIAGAATRDGVFLIQAFNSRRFFAFVERTIFHTPYCHAAIQLNEQPPAAVRVDLGKKVCLQVEMGSRRDAASEQMGGWEGPICLPPRGTARADDQRVFFGRLAGMTATYPFVAGLDRWTVDDQAGTVFEALVQSNFQPTEWQLRPNATHGKSKTIHCPRGVFQK